MIPKGLQISMGNQMRGTSDGEEFCMELSLRVATGKGLSYVRPDKEAGLTGLFRLSPAPPSASRPPTSSSSRNRPDSGGGSATNASSSPFYPIPMTLPGVLLRTLRPNSKSLLELVSPPILNRFDHITMYRFTFSTSFRL